MADIGFVKVSEICLENMLVKGFFKKSHFRIQLPSGWGVRHKCEILTERRTPFLFFLICTNASQISTRLMSLPTMANYLISLPDTYREDEIQNGSQIVLCSQPNTERGPHRSETPTLLERQQRKIYIYKFRGSIPRIPPSPQQKARLHPKQSGLRTLQRCLFERHLSAFGDTSSFASTGTAAQGNV